MSIHHRWILSLAVLVCTNAFAKTKLVQSWADPSAAGYAFNKVLAMAVIENAEIRRVAEAAIVKNIKRAKAIPSCTVLAQGDERDVESLKRKVREQGFDSAVVIRMADVNHKVQYVAPNVPDPYTSYWAYNTYAWPLGGTPGYVKHDQILQVEMLFYSVTKDKLLWSGVIESSNPVNPVQLIDDMAKVIAKELKKKGIVK